jgi:hypothetical protein
MPPDAEKQKNEHSGLVKCPKCGHEFHCKPGWQKVSITVGCPKCAEIVRVNDRKDIEK